MQFGYYFSQMQSNSRPFLLMMLINTDKTLKNTFQIFLADRLARIINLNFYIFFDNGRQSYSFFFSF